MGPVRLPAGRTGTASRRRLAAGGPAASSAAALVSDNFGSLERSIGPVRRLGVVASPLHRPCIAPAVGPENGIGKRSGESWPKRSHKSTRWPPPAAEELKAGRLRGRPGGVPRQVPGQPTARSRALMKLMGGVPEGRRSRPSASGRMPSRTDLTAAFDRQAGVSSGSAKPVAGRDAFDVTEPGDRPAVGTRHVLMRTVDELTDLFARMGFSVAAGPEVEDEFHNFVALNIPRQHPRPRPAGQLLPRVGRTRPGPAPACGRRPAPSRSA